MYVYPENCVIFEIWTLRSVLFFKSEENENKPEL